MAAGRRAAIQVIVEWVLWPRDVLGAASMCPPASPPQPTDGYRRFRGTDPGPQALCRLKSVRMLI